VLKLNDRDTKARSRPRSAIALVFCAVLISSARQWGYATGRGIWSDFFSHFCVSVSVRKIFGVLEDLQPRSAHLA